MLATLITCAIMGHGAFTHPDNAWGCTPGHFDRITHAQACTHRDRPTLHAADRRAILAAYGVPGWSGADGELDHREPFWLDAQILTPPEGGRQCPYRRSRSSRRA